MKNKKQIKESITSMLINEVLDNHVGYSISRYTEESDGDDIRYYIRLRNDISGDLISLCLTN